MRNLKKIITLTLGVVLLTSCEKETIQEETTTALTAQIGISAKSQIPNVQFDTTTKGIYHGIIASKTTQSRGKVWFNLENNTKNTAIIEMVDGTNASFTGTKTIRKSGAVYHFIGKKGSFTVTENTVNNPIVTNAKLQDEDCHVYVIKSTSTRIATSYTGTFNETGNPAFAGTWNILSNGIVNPGGFGGVAISDVMVTFGATMYVDTTMETTGGLTCFGFTNIVPLVDFFDFTGNGFIALDQQSNFNGISNWSVGFDQAGFISAGYFDETCSGVPSGTFSWTNGTNGTMRSGEIFVDVL